MEQKDVLDALKKLREESKKRNFKQSVDFSIILKEVDLNSVEGKIDEFFVLPYATGRKVKICALVDKDLTTQAKEACDKVISKDEFSEWSGKKAELKRLASEYDFFIAQATIMTDIAATFGKVFGPKGKMPNPKSGCIVPPKFDLNLLVKKLQRTARIQTKKQPVISTIVGTEGMADEEISKNVLSVYEVVNKKLPRGDQQIKRKCIKFTMSKPVIF